MSTQIREIVRLLNEPPFAKNLSLCASLCLPAIARCSFLHISICRSVNRANRFGFGVHTQGDVR
jgi:hypothetical protein